MMIIINMEHFLKQLRDNWVILVFIAMLISSWTMTNSRLAQAETRILELQSVVTEINEININIAVIQEHLKNIDKKI